jgi:hypothetical protein
MMKELQMMAEDHVAHDCFLILQFHLYSLNTNFQVFRWYLKTMKSSASQKAYIIQLFNGFRCNRLEYLP